MHKTYKRGRIWQISTDEFKTLIKNSNSITEVLRYFGYNNFGGGYRMLKQRLMKECISYSHINKRKYTFKPIVPNELFCINSMFSNSTLRRYILRNHIIQYKCVICELGPIWYNKPMTLILDHINGVNNDHRIENLRFLCPNCEMQTDTRGGKNIDWSKSPFIIEAQNRRIIKAQNIQNKKLTKKIFKQTSRCPDKLILEKIIWQIPTTHIANKYGVSDKAVTKWCNKLGINKPGPGYWAKQLIGE